MEETSGNRPGLASAGGSFPRGDYLDKYRRCVVAASVWVGCRVQQEKRLCLYVTDK